MWFTRTNRCKGVGDDGFFYALSQSFDMLRTTILVMDKPPRFFGLPIDDMDERKSQSPSYTMHDCG